MPSIRENRTLPYAQEQIFDLVADVGRYAEFLPWVVATRIRSDTDQEMIADMVVGFKSFREKFTSRVEKQRPGLIIAHYIDGPMRDLNNRWEISEDGASRCLINFSVDFTFKSRVFEKLAGKYMDRAFRQLVSAFEQRADQLYGSNNFNAHNVA